MRPYRCAGSTPAPARRGADFAATVGTVLGLLYLFPIMAAVTDPHWRRHLEQTG